jgi:hypothetical protein
MFKTCEHCGETFHPKYPGLKLCYSCWRKKERAFAEYDDLINEVHRLRHELIIARHHQQPAPATPAIPVPP